MARILYEPYVKHPFYSKVIEPILSGNPIPSPAEVRYHKGQPGNSDFRGIFVEMDLGEWFTLTIHVYDSDSLSGERRQDGYGDMHGSVVPLAAGKFCGKDDPKNFICVLQSYCNQILLQAYRALPRKIIKINQTV